MVAWTLVFHIIGLVFWVGGLLVVTHVLAAHSGEASAEGRAALGQLGMKLLKGLAHPGAALMVISGVLLLVQQSFALHATWMHAKLFLVAALVALDWHVYSRTKAVQAGQIEMARGECMALHGMIAAAFTIILVLVLVKPFA